MDWVRLYVYDRGNDESKKPVYGTIYRYIYVQKQQSGSRAVWIKSREYQGGRAAKPFFQYVRLRHNYLR
jgi:hypothetical protein